MRPYWDGPPLQSAEQWAPRPDFGPMWPPPVPRVAPPAMPLYTRVYCEPQGYAWEGNIPARRDWASARATEVRGGSGSVNARRSPVLSSGLEERRASQQHTSTSGRTTSRDYRPSGGPPVTRKREATQSPARIRGVDDGGALDGARHAQRARRVRSRSCSPHQGRDHGRSSESSRGAGRSLNAPGGMDAQGGRDGGKGRKDVFGTRDDRRGKDVGRDQDVQRVRDEERTRDGDRGKDGGQGGRTVKEDDRGKDERRRGDRGRGGDRGRDEASAKDAEAGGIDTGHSRGRGSGERSSERLSSKQRSRSHSRSRSDVRGGGRSQASSQPTPAPGSKQQHAPTNRVLPSTSRLREGSAGEQRQEPQGTCGDAQRREGPAEQAGWPSVPQGDQWLVSSEDELDCRPVQIGGLGNVKPGLQGPTLPPPPLSPHASIAVGWPPAPQQPYSGVVSEMGAAANEAGASSNAAALQGSQQGHSVGASMWHDSASGAQAELRATPGQEGRLTANDLHSISSQPADDLPSSQQLQLSSLPQASIDSLVSYFLNNSSPASGPDLDNVPPAVRELLASLGMEDSKAPPSSNTEAAACEALPAVPPSLPPAPTCAPDAAAAIACNNDAPHDMWAQGLPSRALLQAELQPQPMLQQQQQLHVGMHQPQLWQPQHAMLSLGVPWPAQAMPWPFAGLAMPMMAPGSHQAVIAAQQPSVQQSVAPKLRTEPVVLGGGAEQRAWLRLLILQQCHSALQLLPVEPMREDQVLIVRKIRQRFSELSNGLELDLRQCLPDSEQLSLREAVERLHSDVAVVALTKVLKSSAEEASHSSQPQQGQMPASQQQQQHRLASELVVLPIPGKEEAIAAKFADAIAQCLPYQEARRALAQAGPAAGLAGPPVGHRPRVPEPRTPRELVARLRQLVIFLFSRAAKAQKVEESQVVLSLECIQQQWEVAVGKPLDVGMTGHPTLLSFLSSCLKDRVAVSMEEHGGHSVARVRLLPHQKHAVVYLGLHRGGVLESDPGEECAEAAASPAE